MLKVRQWQIFFLTIKQICLLACKTIVLWCGYIHLLFSSIMIYSRKPYLRSITPILGSPHIYTSSFVFPYGIWRSFSAKFILLALLIAQRRNWIFCNSKNKLQNHDFYKEMGLCLLPELFIFCSYSFVGGQISVRHSDGALISCTITPFAFGLNSCAVANKWDQAIRLCRHIQVCFTILAEILQVGIRMLEPHCSDLNLIKNIW